VRLAKEGANVGDLQTARQKEAETAQKMLQDWPQRQKALTAQVLKRIPAASLYLPQARLSWEAVRQTLAPDEAFLSYSIIDKEVSLFTVTREGTARFPLPCSLPELQKEIAQWRDALQVSGAQTYYRKGGKSACLLYDWLIRPAKRAIKKKARWLLSLEGDLHTLPFAALMDNTQQRPTPYANLKRYAYLSEQKRLSLCPSLSILMQWRRQQVKSARDARVLAVGNPEMRGRQSGNLPAVWQRCLKSMGALPDFQAQVEALKGQWKQVETLVGAQATTERVESLLPSADIAYIGCHGAFPNSQEIPAALVLAPSRATNDGLLSYERILRLGNLRARIVFLSACETGKGLLDRSEGPQSMARAFEYSGARAVISTLWKTPSASALCFSNVFFAAIKGGQSTLDAFHQAQEAVRKNPAFHLPEHWAGYILNGDAR
jgi:CHAT domain-containing protein